VLPEAARLWADRDDAHRILEHDGPHAAAIHYLRVQGMLPRSRLKRAALRLSRFRRTSLVAEVAFMLAHERQSTRDYEPDTDRLAVGGVPVIMAGGHGYREGTVAGAVAKRRQRMFYASAAALRRVAAHVATTRADAVRRARRHRRYEQVPGKLVVTRIGHGARPRIAWRDEYGRAAEAPLGGASLAQARDRRRGAGRVDAAEVAHEVRGPVERGVEVVEPQGHL
jgi:hypothetical protein